MRDRRAEFGEAEIVVVLFTRERNLRGYRSRFVAPLTVVGDEGRDVYVDYGLSRATDPEKQPGGTFVVGRHGRLTLTYRQETADGHPPIDELIEVVDHS